MCLSLQSLSLSHDTPVLFSIISETLPKGTIIWDIGDSGSSAKLFLTGKVLAYVPNDCDGDDSNWFRSSMTEGTFLGMRGLVLGEKHLATVQCEEESIFYSLDRRAYERLDQECPEAARVLEISLARYLSHRLTHVSNRIYKERSLPI